MEEYTDERSPFQKIMDKPKELVSQLLVTFIRTNV
jgi:hypothetical protein